jgi:hypothetical protein
MVEAGKRVLMYQYGPDALMALGLGLGNGRCLTRNSRFADRPESS